LSQELERVYTIPLGKVLLSQSQHRSVRAINMIREFARKHMKTQEIKIDEEVAHLIWSRGVRRPPRKIRVKMTKTDEGHILVSSYEEEIESKEIPAEVDVPKVTKEVDAEKIETDKDGEVEEYIPTKTSEDEIKKESKPKAAPKKESKPKAAPKKESKPKAAPKKESKPKAAPKKESKPKAAPKKESK
jgi:large subunit ribosomal protein L31e